MARTGRPPKPTALKLLEGNPGKRAIKPDVKIAPGKPTRPRWLSSSAQKRVWDSLVGMLPETLLEQCDVWNLASLVSAIVELEEAEAEKRKHGLIVDGMHGPKANPAVQMAASARNQIQRLGAEFGLSPTARARLTIPEAEDDDLADLLTPAHRREA